MGRHSKLKKRRKQQQRSPEFILEQMKKIVKENQKKYEEEQSKLVKNHSRETLLNSEDWVYKTLKDGTVYGKLTVLLNHLGLNHRIDECLTQGFINFNEIYDDEDEELIFAYESIKYSPDSDKAMCESHWE